MKKLLSKITVVLFLLLNNTQSLGMEIAPVEIQRKIFKRLDVPSFYAMSQTSQKMRQNMLDYEPLYAPTVLKYATAMLESKKILLERMREDRDQFRIYKKEFAQYKKLYATFDDKFRSSEANFNIALLIQQPKTAISFAQKVVPAPYSLPWQENSDLPQQP